jgi:hypothetical protein
MRWIRANRRGGGALALLALVVQLAVTLGHIHAPLSAPLIALNIAAPGDQALPPNDGKPQRQTDGTCDICAVLHMASAGQLAAPPSLALPITIVVARNAVIGDPAIASRRHVLAQSRAPPIV